MIAKLLRPMYKIIYQEYTKVMLLVNEVTYLFCLDFVQK